MIDLQPSEAKPPAHGDQVEAISTTSGGLLSQRWFRLGAIGGGAVAILSALSTDDGPVLCPFRICTGGYCPACGMTRSGGRLLRGDLAGSLQQHPYLPFAVVQVAVLALIWRLGSVATRSRVVALARPLLAVNAIALVCIWIARMATDAIPVPFLS